jgi:hypothetical protein
MTESFAPTETRRPRPGQWPSIELIQDIVAGVLDDQGRGETAADVGLEACQRLDRLQRAHHSAALRPIFEPGR